VKVNKDRYDEDRSGNKIWSSKVERFNGGKAGGKAHNERWKKLKWADWAMSKTENIKKYTKLS
jgi:hypothetical protein